MCGTLPSSRPTLPELPYRPVVVAMAARGSASPSFLQLLVSLRQLGSQASDLDPQISQLIVASARFSTDFSALQARWGGVLSGWRSIMVSTIRRVVASSQSGHLSFQRRDPRGKAHPLQRFEPGHKLHPSGRYLSYASETLSPLSEFSDWVPASRLICSSSWLMRSNASRFSRTRASYSVGRPGSWCELDAASEESEFP